jgi:hypothetical protein
MDDLQKCALAFQKLLNYEYHFVVGRKGQKREFYLNFNEADFHHLAGLHKLKDIAQIQQGMRSKIFNQILIGEISTVLIEKSTYYSQMVERILPLTDLENMLDDNQLIFRYNEKVHKYSLIQADYLLEGNAGAIPSYLFLCQRNDSETEQMCRTFFRAKNKNYADGQPRWTLLKKEKRCLSSGEMVCLYDRC